MPRRNKRAELTDKQGKRVQPLVCDISRIRGTACSDDIVKVYYGGQAGPALVCGKHVQTDLASAGAGHRARLEAES